MPTEAPWEVIRRAADRLEELAGQAAPGPWRDLNHGWCICSEPSADKATWRTVTGGVGDVANSDWICALSPAVAEPLVAWLRAAATVLEGYGCYWVMVPDWVRSAGDLAATILGVELWTGSVDHG